MNNEMTIKQMLDASGPVSRFVPAQTAELIMGLASAVRQLTEQRDAVVAESSGIQKRMRQLVDIIEKADNGNCMCGEAMNTHGLGGCGSPTGMFDYHYGRWVESETENHTTDAAIAALRAEATEAAFNSDKHAALCDSAYVSGMQVGWNFGVDENAEGFQQALEAYRKPMREARRQLRESKGAQG